MKLEYPDRGYGLRSKSSQTHKESDSLKKNAIDGVHSAYLECRSYKMNKIFFFILIHFISFILVFNVNAFDYFINNESTDPVISLINKLPDKWKKDENITIDMLSILSVYKDSCIGIEVRDGDKLFLIMKNNKRILYDSKIDKSFDEKINNADLKDMMSQVYHLGGYKENPRIDFDPGRIRSTIFFKYLYGETSGEVKKNLTTVKFIDRNVAFNKRNGAAKALSKVSEEISALLLKKPKLIYYIKPLGGTYFWRYIANTERLSPHSFGIAIDLNSTIGGYWQWDKPNKRNSSPSNKYPSEIIEIFEKHGFIWGGKWYHYDLMHFEYRPEMIFKGRYKYKNATFLNH